MTLGPILHSKLVSTLSLFASLSAVVAVSFGAAHAQAQPPAGVAVMLSGVPSCATCTITLTRGATLDTRDSLTVGATPGVALIRGGGILAWGFKADHPGPILFDSTGRVARVLMRRGQGPGEVGFARHVAITASDTVMVYDVTLQRHVFSPALSFVRREPGVHVPTSALLRADGSGIVSMGTLNSDTVVELPLHQVAANGSLVRSFGLEDRPLAGRSTPANTRPPSDYRIYGDEPSIVLDWRVVPGASGRFWSYSVHKLAGFQVEERNATGQRLRFFRHANDGWYGQIPSEGAAGSITWQVVPSAQPDLLWIAYTVRTPGVPIPPQVGGRPNDLSPWVTGYDVVVEAVDLRRNQVVAVQRFTGAAAWPVSNATDTIALAAPLSADIVSLQLARLTLRQP